jgi:hypothetical protein
MLSGFDRTRRNWLETDRKYGGPEEYHVDTQEEVGNNGNNH